MVYGFMTHSYLNSSENRQMQQLRRAVTAEWYAAERQRSGMTREEAEKATSFCACGRLKVSVCDWKVSGKVSGTCDEPLCECHRVQVSPLKFLCPEHERAWIAWQKRHPPAQASLFTEAS
jgi:hypothetical protein